MKGLADCAAGIAPGGMAVKKKPKGIQRAMTIFTTIDIILQNAIVRWAMLAAVAALSVFSVWQTVRLAATKLLLRAEKGTSAEYAAKLGAQSDAIKKAGDDMQAIKKRLNTANMEAEMLSKRLKNRTVGVREIVMQGDCPAMVQQVIDEVRK